MGFSGAGPASQNVLPTRLCDVCLPAGIYRIYLRPGSSYRFANRRSKFCDTEVIEMGDDGRAEYSILGIRNIMVICFSLFGQNDILCKCSSLFPVF